MRFRVVLSLSAVAVLSSCVHVRTDPIQVEPIHITVDVYVRVDRALDDFFRDIDADSRTLDRTPDEP
jgi:hypothetical protein